MAIAGSFFEELDAEAEGLADIEAGRVIPHEEIVAWLATWGRPDEEATPESWFK